MTDVELVAAFRVWLGPRRRMVLAALTPKPGRARELGQLAEAVRARGLGRTGSLEALDRLHAELVVATGLGAWAAGIDEPVEVGELPWVLRDLVQRMTDVEADPGEVTRVGAVAAASVLGSQLHGAKSGPTKLAATLRWLGRCVADQGR